ncbi:MAG: hypothetical protein FH756_05815 [Firmicutes bacterium]|nr:hypothetical protein [Bacillota bacterium]
MVDKFVELLGDFEKGDYLYYGYFKNEINITDEDFVVMTNVLIRMGIVEKVYKLFCPECGEISRTLYYDINEIKTADICEKCDNELVGPDESYKYIVVFFRLV